MRAFCLLLAFFTTANATPTSPPLSLQEGVLLIEPILGKQGSIFGIAERRYLIERITTRQLEVNKFDIQVTIRPLAIHEN